MARNDDFLWDLQTVEGLGSATRWLLAEADVGLTASHWAIINNGSDRARHRLYDAAALRHACDLLSSIALAAEAGDELAVRILGRAHVEAWLTATYLHFGGPDALMKIAQDTLRDTKVTDEEIKGFDQKLARAKSEAQQRVTVAEANNEGIARWNEQHPDNPRPLRSLPRVPKQPAAGVDLSTRIADFGGIDARKLPLNAIAGLLTKLGPSEGFANEDFAQVYLYYRLMSGASAHPTLHLYDSYFQPPGGYFVHTSPRPVGDSLIITTWSNALYSTALHVGWVLQDGRHETPVASVLRAHLDSHPAAEGFVNLGTEADAGGGTSEPPETPGRFTKPIR